jgi:hypothetical protein
MISTSSSAQKDKTMDRKLPRGCAGGQVAKRDEATQTWVCAEDIDTTTDITALQGQVDALQSALDALVTQFNAHMADPSAHHVDEGQLVAELDDLLMHFTRIGDDIFIDGANLHVRNGLGSTETTNAVGNIIIGYNEERDPTDPACNFVDCATMRFGSHILAVGSRLNYTTYGGIVVGDWNTTTGAFASVSGGEFNEASGAGSSVSGGQFNEASGDRSSVSGGQFNEASGDRSWVSGGTEKEASGDFSSVSGGGQNEASGTRSSVSGGFSHEASGASSHPNTHNL